VAKKSAKKQNPARGIRLHGSTYELNIQRNGVRQFINLETTDFAEAVKRAEEVRRNPTLLPGSGLDAEIERFITYKLAKRQYTEHTARTKKNKLQLLRAAVPPGSSAASVTTAQLQRWHDDMESQLESATIHGYMMTARAFFRWAIDVAKLRRRNPVEGLKMVKLEKRARKDFCSYELRDRLVRDCEDPELKFILFAGFHAGLRFSEISEAVPWWFDLEHFRISLRKTPTMRFKDNEERAIPLTREFAEFLRGYGLRAPFMVAPDARKGKWLYRYDFRAKFMSYMRAQNAPRWLTPHTMRHTFASLLVSAGESIYKVAMWLGDDVRTVQNHYGHLAPDEGGIEKAFSAREHGIHAAAFKGSGHSPAVRRSQAASS
jgi:site-specific recombinase XerD